MRNADEAQPCEENISMQQKSMQSKDFSPEELIFPTAQNSLLQNLTTGLFLACGYEKWHSNDHDRTFKGYNRILLFHVSTTRFRIIG